MIHNDSPQTKSDRTFKYLIVGLGAFFLLTLVFVVFVFQKMMGDSAPRILSGSKEITLLEIQGPIYSSDSLVRRIRRFRKSDDKAMILRLDSPGGSVAPSQEIYSEVLKARREDKKIIVASMAGVAASGAYYIASACDRIVCNPGTITGSIGVIAEFPDASGLMNKIGLHFQTVKSGKFKDTGAMDRPLNAAERAYLQETINDVFQQFVDAVIDARKTAFQEKCGALLHKKPAQVTDAEIRVHILKFADGRILTGRKACQEGFADQIGNYYDAVKLTADLAGIKGDPTVRRDPSMKMDKYLTSLLPVDFWNRARTGLHLNYMAY